MEEEVELEYFKGLIKDGLDPKVLIFLKTLADINNQPVTYFVKASLEEFVAYLSQDSNVGDEEEFNELFPTRH